MSLIKNHLLQQQEEEQELLMCYLEWAEDNKELWQQLAVSKEWLQEEVIGYEE